MFFSTEHSLKFQLSHSYHHDWFAVNSIGCIVTKYFTVFAAVFHYEETMILFLKLVSTFVY